jgi:hypothetical protein
MEDILFMHMDLSLDEEEGAFTQGISNKITKAFDRTSVGDPRRVFDHSSFFA